MKLSTEQIHTRYQKEEIKIGWLCPRCNKINSPFVQQCDCHTSITYTCTKSDYAATITANQYQ